MQIQNQRPNYDLFDYFDVGDFKIPSHERATYHSDFRYYTCSIAFCGLSKVKFTSILKNTTNIVNIALLYMRILNSMLLKS